MKKSKHMLWAVVLLVQFSLASAGLSATVVVNVDFQPSGGSYSVNYSGQGAYSDPGNNTWNVVAPTPDSPSDDGFEYGGYYSGGNGISGQALVTSSGSGSGMTLSTADGVALAMDTDHGGYGDIATDATGLMSDYLQMDSDGFARSVFVEGLTVGLYYNLYLYGAGPWDRDTTFDVRLDDDTAKDYGGAQYVGQKTTDATTGSHTLTANADYVLFSFTPAAGMDTLWIEYKGDGDGDNIAPFNGFQLIESDEEPPPGGAVPEPSTAFLLVMGGMVVLSSRRRLLARHA
ncbi:MAG: PEP-CTERM sorting domain-containing protein [Verrucomicrobia bacterium]|nr:PEP-CTERM sorting domain-containing protein [Verrucomicrobiota bacterium]